MKKGIKKLSLDRETVLSLDQGKVAGGLDTHFDHTCGGVCSIISWACSHYSNCHCWTAPDPEVVSRG